jgi:hypothetical protein
VTTAAECLLDLSPKPFDLGGWICARKAAMNTPTARCRTDEAALAEIAAAGCRSPVAELAMLTACRSSLSRHAPGAARRHTS